ncbi:MAG: hypothetical protein FWH35_05870 [Treponema sp.]|nr:hypothetical protein [Treponema sp.]
MKHIFIITAFLLCFFGMTAFGQDMSYYSDEFDRADSSFVERLEVLQVVKDANIKGIGEFYHHALKVLLEKTPDIKDKVDRDATDASARIVCQALGAEEYSEAAEDLWKAVEYFDVISESNQGLVMQDALTAIGQVGGVEFVPHIVLRLNDFNTQVISDVETKRRVQRAVVGCISALEALHDISGFRPVFFASTGWYDGSVKTMASVALPNIVDDPGDVIIEIIQDTANIPAIKYEAWRAMLRTRAPDSSVSKVAAVALATGWYYTSPNPTYQKNLSEMRMSAIDTIRQVGAYDSAVYTNLEKSYSNNFINSVPNYDEIRKTLSTLSVLGANSDEGVDLLLKFLRELHARRRSGPWAQKERQLLQWVIPALGSTKTQSQDVRLLLTTIQRSQDYTGAEQGWARSALREMGN